MIHINDMGRLCMSCHKLMAEPGGYCEHCGYHNAAPAAPHHLPPYTILAGKYMVGKVLGEGGFGITYLGFDLNLQIKVAIKEYYPSGNVSRETTRSNTVYPVTAADGADKYQAGLERFLNEARAIAKFHNLNGIVEVRDFFRENGTAYIVMEFIEGVTLARELKDRGRIPANEVLARFEPMIRSLSQVHKEGIIHRDISPDNIISTEKGELKLLDFGAAKEMDAETKSVSVMLKPGYAPEEQYRMHGNQGPWTDCYALCATLYKLMTGVTPQESLERLVEDRLTAPTQLGAELSPLQEKAILMGMTVKMEDRFKSVDALYNALYSQGMPQYDRVYIANDSTARPAMTHAEPAKTALSGVYSPQKKKSKIPLILAIVFVALAAAACVYFFVIRKPAEDPLESSRPTPAATTWVEQTPASTSGSLTEGFRTPEPVISANTISEFVSNPGTIRVPAFSAFTNASRIKREESEGVTTYYFAFDPSAMTGYAMLLDATGACEIEYGDEENNLCILNQNGVRIAFDLIDGMLAVSAPEGVTIEEYGVDVDYRYLENNGLNYYSWQAIDDSRYCAEGINYRGNTPANIMNASCVAMQGEYLYYTEYTDTGYLYRQPLKGGKSELLLDAGMYAVHLSACGDYLYFTAYSEELGYRSIYRMPIHGDSDDLELLRENASMPMPIGDYICFKNMEDNSLMRMLPDGSEAEVISGGENYFINVMWDQIYVCDTDQGTGLYAIDPGTFEQTLVLEEDIYRMVVSGDYVFYVAGEDKDYALYRYDLYSQESECISDIVADSLNTDGKNLYLATEAGELYSMTIDGEETVLLAEGVSNPVVVCNGSVTRLFYLINEGMDLVEYDLQSGEIAELRP